MNLTFYISTSNLDIFTFVSLSFLFIWILTTLSTKVLNDWWKDGQCQYPNVEDICFFPQILFSTYHYCTTFLFRKKHIVPRPERKKR